MKRPLYRSMLCIALLAMLGACASSDGLRIDHSLQAPSHNSRVRYLVLHYTTGTQAHAIQALTGPKVSAHYLVSDTDPVIIYSLVDEHRRAWHAGQGSWYGNPDINTGSIGIEIVNAGRLGPQDWAPYPAKQVHAIEKLVKDVVTRHGIAARNIIAHSDMAPQRKIDPGPLFPWQQLAQAGLGRWYNAEQAAQLMRHYQERPLPDAQQIQTWLQNAGYETPSSGRYDTATTNVIRAFQMHYRPARYDGKMDAETLAILLSLE